MKRFIALSMVIMLLSGSLLAAGSDLFSYDKEAVNNEMADLNALENYVKENTGITLADLKANNSSLLTNLNISEIFSPSFAFNEPPLGIPSFLWGCCLWTGGVLIVYIMTDNDRDEVKKAFKGCVISTVTYVTFYIILWALVLSSPAPYYY